MKASTYFSPGDVARIEAAIAHAERRTSGEIVVAVATRSGQYDRGEDLFGVVTALGFVTAAWLMFQNFNVDTSDWTATATASLGLVSMLALFVGGFAIGAMVATRLPILATLFSTRKEMQERVENQAKSSFHVLAVRRTSGATGVLIYVSLLERTVSVIADHAISDRIDGAVWHDIQQIVVAGFRETNACAALTNAIERAGKVLASELPIGDGDTNELHNRLRLLD